MKKLLLLVCQFWMFTFANADLLPVLTTGCLLKQAQMEMTTEPVGPDLYLQHLSQQKLDELAVLKKTSRCGGFLNLAGAVEDLEPYLAKAAVSKRRVQWLKKI